MKILWSSVLILIPLLFFTCTKKKLEFDVVQNICEKLTLATPDYTILSDPCDSTSLTASFEITFTYDGSEECLHTVGSAPCSIQKRMTK